MIKTGCFLAIANIYICNTKTTHLIFTVFRWLVVFMFRGGSLNFLIHHFIFSKKSQF